jgi:hypothetical protein
MGEKKRRIFRQETQKKEENFKRIFSLDFNLSPCSKCCVYFLGVVPRRCGV